MGGQAAQVVSVVKQEGDRVLLSVPMVGFPPKFQLRPGERVVLVNDVSGPVARPLVKESVVSSPRSLLIKDGTLEIDGKPHSVQPAALVHETLLQGHMDQAGEYVVRIIDPGTADGPPQVLAIHPRR